MAVLQGVEHGGAHAEKAVIRHVVVHHRAIHFAHRVPINVFHIEKSILLVHLVPKVVEHIDGVRGFVLLHEGTLARGEGESQNDEDKWFFHSFNQLILNIKDKLRLWRALS